MLNFKEFVINEQSKKRKTLGELNSKDVRETSKKMAVKYKDLFTRLADA